MTNQLTLIVTRRDLEGLKCHAVRRTGNRHGDWCVPATTNTHRYRYRPTLPQGHDFVRQDNLECDFVRLRNTRMRNHLRLAVRTERVTVRPFRQIGTVAMRVTE